MGRPFRLASERRQIARPSYGGEREPDSHPTPGPPTFVQSARVQLPSRGRAPRSSPGVVRSLGRFLRVPHAWIAEALPPSSDTRVASLVPPVFDAYARVFHPAVRYPDDELFGIDSEEPDVDVTWAEVAAHNGRTAHPAMAWAAITGSTDFLGSDDQPGLWNDSPAVGHLPATVATRLAGVLARHTTTPAECWFGVDTTWRPDAEPGLTLGDVDYVLVRGPVALAAANFAEEPAEQSAHLWWPDDRAWFVATDADLMTTYVGGSTACIAELVGADGIEAAQVPVDERVTPDADTVNPPPVGPPA